MQTRLEGRARYFVTFIDDHTRWCEVYFMRKKSEIADKFQEFMKMTENQIGRRIKAVQSDNSKEYCNATLDNVFKKRGIHHRLTVAHIPQQNGVAERKNLLCRAGTFGNPGRERGDQLTTLVTENSKLLIK